MSRHRKLPLEMFFSCHSYWGLNKPPFNHESSQALKLSLLWSNVTTYSSSLWSNVMTYSSSLWSNVTTYSSSLWSNVTTYSSSLWSNVTTYSSSLWSNVTTYSSSLWSNVTAYSSSLWGRRTCCFQLTLSFQAFLTTFTTFRIAAFDPEQNHTRRNTSCTKI